MKIVTGKINTSYPGNAIHCVQEILKIYLVHHILLLMNIFLYRTSVYNVVMEKFQNIFSRVTDLDW